MRLVHALTLAAAMSVGIGPRRGDDILADDWPTDWPPTGEARRRKVRPTQNGAFLPPLAYFTSEKPMSKRRKRRQRGKAKL